MHKNRRFTGLLTTSISLLAPAFAATSAINTPIDPDKLTTIEPATRYIVTFKNPPKTQTSAQARGQNKVFVNNRFSNDNANRFIRQHGGKVKRHLSSINGIAAELTPAQVNQLKNDAQVQLIEEDPVRTMQADTAPYGIAQAQADLLSDAAIGNQKVCVIDTGYDINHEDLMNTANITGEVSNTLTSPVDLGEWSTDTYGHGTHVAGTISALNNNIGTAGLAPNGLINLHIVKVIHKANYWEYWGSDVIAAVEACQAAGSTVINMSMAGKNSSAAEEAAIDSAYAAGILLVAAAGNRGNSDYYYPASYDSVISTGAVDQSGDAWSATNFNDKVELVAAGVGVYSTLPNNRYGYMDGTSAATPFVSGVAALVWSLHPNCSNQQIREALQNTALDKGDVGLDPTYGYGIVQAQAASDYLDSIVCDLDGGGGDPGDGGGDPGDGGGDPGDGGGDPGDGGGDPGDGGGDPGDGGGDPGDGGGGNTGPGNGTGGGSGVGNNQPTFNHRVQLNTDANVSIEFISGNVTVAPTHGTLTPSGNNTLYTPTAGYVGLDGFTYLNSEGVAQYVRIEVGRLGNGSGVLVDITDQTHTQLNPRITPLTNGDTVVVWYEYFQSTYTILFQRFNAAGVALTGKTEVYSSTHQYEPVVAATKDGGFVISWQQSSNLYAKQYAANNIGGDLITVSTASGAQNDPDVATLSNGDFVIVWDDEGANQFKATIYSSAGVPILSNIALFSDITGLQREVSVMAMSNGDFIVAGVIHDQIVSQRFNQSGELVGSQVVVTTTATWPVAEHKQIDMQELDADRYVIGWTTTTAQDGDSYSVIGRIFGSNDDPVSDEFILSQYTAKKQQNVRLMATEHEAFGDFIAIWQSDAADGDDWAVMGRQFNRDGEPLNDEFRIFGHWQFAQSLPDITMLADGQIAVALLDNNGDLDQVKLVMLSPGTTQDDILQGDEQSNILLGGDGNNTLHGEAGDDLLYQGTLAYGGDGDDTFYGGKVIHGGNGHDDIYISSENGVIDGGADHDVVFFTGNFADYTIEDNLNNSYTITDNRLDSPDGINTLSNIEAIEFADDRRILDDPQPQLLWQNRVQVNSDTTVAIDFIAGDIGISPSHGTLTPNGNSHNYTPEAGFSGLDSFTYLDGQGVTQTVRIEVGQLGNSASVSVEEPTDNQPQQFPQLAALSNGDTVVVWREYYNSTYTIAFQRFTAAGIALTDKVKVYNSTHQYEPAVTATANGGFIITWQQSTNIYAMPFAADNSTGELITVSVASGAQNDPAITSLANNDFVIAWDDEGSNSLKATLYSPTGEPRLSNFALFTNPATGTLREVNIMAQADGGFMVAGVLHDQIVSQRFSHVGLPFGDPVIVDTDKTWPIAEHNQIDLLELTDGRYVISWSSTSAQDGDDYSVIARVFEVDGTPATGEIVLSQYNSKKQQHVRLANSPDENNGDFIAIWQSDAADGDDWAVMGRHFNRDAQPLADEFQVYAHWQFAQYEPDIAILKNGEIAVTLVDNDGDLNKVKLVMLSPGGAGDDILEGNDQGNILIGNGGSNTINGNGGDDVIYDGTIAFGGDGDDTFYGGNVIHGGNGHDDIYINGDNGAIHNGAIDGGADYDVVFFSGDFADYTIFDNGNGTYTITDNRPGSPDGTNTLTRIEAVEFANDRRVLEDIRIALPQWQHRIQLNADGDSIAEIDFISGEITVSPIHGSLIWDGSRHQYTPNEGYTGLDTFTYLNLLDEPQVVRIEVNQLGNSSRVSVEAPTDNQPQQFPQVAALNNGDTVVVWREYYDSTYTIAFQRFTAAGIALTGKTKVYNSTHQYEPAIAPTADGGFIITWQQSSNIYAMPYAADNTQGTLITVSVASGAQNDPAIAVLANNDFMIVWDDEGANRLKGTLYSPSGEPRLSNIVFFPDTAGTQREVNIMAQADGGFMVAGIIGDQLFTRRFSHTGLPFSDPIVVDTDNTWPIAEHNQIDMLELDNNRYVISWSSTSAQDGDSYSAMARIFDVDGTSLTTEIVLSQYGSKKQQSVRLARATYAQPGDFLAIWQSDGADLSGEAVMGRYFNQTGLALTDEFRVAGEWQLDQYQPDVTVLTGGQIAVTLAANDGDLDRVELLMLSPGSAASDILQGDAQNNVLMGNGGDNTLFGEAGEDLLYNAALAFGGDGNDTFYGGIVLHGGDGHDDFYIDANNGAIDGGADFDVVFFTGEYADYGISYNEDGSYTVADNRPGSPDGDNILTRIEAIEFVNDRRVLEDVQLPAVQWQHRVQMPINTPVEIDFISGDITEWPIHGSLLVNGSSYDYTPNGGYIGLDTFTYLNAQDEPQIVRIEVGQLSNGSSVPVEASSDGQPQLFPQLAALSNGDTVVVWREYYDSTYTIAFQRFTASGVALTGKTKVYNSTHQYEPAIAATVDGGFVISWQQSSNIYAMPYAADNTQGTLITVSTASGAQNDPAIAPLTNGDFMVVWDDEGANQFKGTLYSATGEPQRANMVLFPDVSGTQREVSIMAQADGGFMVAGVINDEIYSQRFSHNGLPFGLPTVVTTSNTWPIAEHQQIDLLELDNGRYVIAWASTTAVDGDSYTAIAQVFAADGTLEGTEIVLNQYSSKKQQNVRLVSTPSENDGDFMAVWQSDGADQDDWAVMARRYNRLGQPLADEFRVYGQWQHAQYQPDVALLAGGQIAVALSNNDGSLDTIELVMLSPGTNGDDTLQGDDQSNILIGNGGNNTIFGEAGDDLIYDGTLAYGGDGNDTFYGGNVILGDSGDDNIYIGSGNSNINGGDDFDVAFFNGDFADYSITENTIGSYTIVDNRPGSPDGTNTLTAVEAIEFANDRRALDVSAAIVAPQWQHTVQLAADGSVSISFIDNIAQSPEHGTLAWDSNTSSYVYTPEAGYSGLDSFTYLDAQSVEQTIRVEVGYQGNSSSVSIEAPSANQPQQFSQLAALNNGDSVVVWREYYDSTYTIAFQRFNAAGTAQTGKVKVYNSTHQYEPAIAATIDGGFIITWQQSNNIYAMPYAADNTQGTLITVSTASGTQNDPAAAGLANGDFVLVWDDEGANQLKGTLYSASGEPKRANIVLFPGISGTQREVSIMAQADGGFMVAGVIDDNLYSQRFSHTGLPFGAPITVNTSNTWSIAEHKQIDLLELDNGRYVIAWTSTTAVDGDSYSVIGQVFNTDGTVVGSEILLNQYGSKKQQNVRLAATADNSFMAVWQSDGADGDDWAVMGRRFNSDGQPLNDEFRAFGSWEHAQYMPDIAVLSNGQIIMSLSDNNGTLDTIKLVTLSPGTAADDVLQGDAQANVLLGEGGNNTLHGHDGDDLLYDGTQAFGGDGNDTFYRGHTLNGGNGNDTFHGGTVIDGGADVDSVFMTGENLDYSVSDNGGGNYTVTDNRPGSPDGTKTLSNVEFIEFTGGQVGL